MSTTKEEVKKDLDKPSDNPLLDALAIQSAPVIFTNIRRLPAKIVVKTTISLDFLLNESEAAEQPKKESTKDEGIKIGDIGLDVHRVYPAVKK